MLLSKSYGMLASSNKWQSSSTDNIYPTIDCELCY